MFSARAMNAIYTYSNNIKKKILADYLLINYKFTKIRSNYL